MLNFQVVLLALFFLVSRALAVEVHYSISYAKTSDHQSSWIGDAGTIPDNKKQMILDNIKAWSGGRYTAKVVPGLLLPPSGILELSNTRPEPDVQATRSAIWDLSNLIRKHVGKAEGDRIQPIKSVSIFFLANVWIHRSHDGGVIREII